MSIATTTTESVERPSGSLDNDVLLAWLRMMTLIREFETRTMQAYSQAQIGGFCHVYTGQEACAVGCIAAVEPDDPVITAYRDHGHALARGMTPKACMAEMFGKLEGCAKGKGGSMHMFDKPNNLFGGHGIVGAHTPLAAGIAFAARYQNEVLGAHEKRVVLCFLGDGALNQGAFHEAMNLAGLLELPVIYVVENNRYAMGTHIARGTTMAHDLKVKADAYGIEALELDGMDVLEIYDHMKPLADRCRDEVQPAFVNIDTYRYHGHSMSDPQKYRSKEEVKEVQERDSIELLKSHLINERRALTEEDFEATKKELRQIVREAMEYSQEATDPQPEDELYTDVYTSPAPQLSPIRDYHQGAKNPLLD